MHSRAVSYREALAPELFCKCPVDVPVLSSGMQVTDLAYADDVALMALSPQGLQRLIDLVCEFCTFMGMVVSVAKTKVMVFNIAFPGPFQWMCGAEQLEIVLDFKYLGILFNALHGMAGDIPHAQEKHVWGMGLAQAPVWAPAMLGFSWSHVQSV